jgi:GT2 family glycosyltransferase
MPAVSVIMPVFNAAAFVEEAVNSVLEQTLQDLELVIVNDGSTDQSAAILNRFDDPRIRVLHQANSGQSAAINRGVRESYGEFIKIVDADDWINPGHLESQLASVQGFSHQLSACRWGYFQKDFTRPIVRDEHANRDYSDPLEWIVDSLTLDEGMMGGWKWLIPRAVWERSGGYDERLSLNNDFHASIAIMLASGGVRFAPEAVYSYRKGLSGALSGTRSRKSMLSALRTTQQGCRLLLLREDSSRIRRLCANRYQRWAFDFFPEHPDLADAAERAATELGGSSVEFTGGWAGRTVSRMIGWRNTRRLQSLAVRAGWGQVRRLKRWWRLRRLA